MAYALVMLTAIVVGATAARWTPRPKGLSAGQKAALGFGGYCGAMIGAKLPFVLSDWAGLASGAAWFSDGKTLMTGLVGGYFGVEITKFILEIRVKTGDGFAVPVAAAVAVGRWGCFLAPCCYGTATALPWGVDFGDGLLRHPTQIYESAFHLSAAVGLAVCQRKGLFPGQLMKLYLLAYLIYRFASEFIRPEPRMWQGLTGYQWTALALIPLFVWLWYRDAQARRKQETVPPVEGTQIRVGDPIAGGDFKKNKIS